MCNLPKNSLEYNNCLYVGSASQWRVRNCPTNNVPSPQDELQKGCRSVIPLLFKTTLRQFV